MRPPAPPAGLHRGPDTPGGLGGRPASRWAGGLPTAPALPRARWPRVQTLQRCLAAPGPGGGSSPTMRRLRGRRAAAGARARRRRFGRAVAARGSPPGFTLPFTSGATPHSGRCPLAARLLPTGLCAHAAAPAPRRLRLPPPAPRTTPHPRCRGAAGRRGRGGDQGAGQLGGGGSGLGTPHPACSMGLTCTASLGGTEPPLPAAAPTGSRQGLWFRHQRKKQQAQRGRPAA